MSFPNLSSAQTIKTLDSNLKSGLTQDKVEHLRQEYGYNQLPEKEGTSLFMLVLEQFKDQLVLILLGAAFISFLLAYYEQEGNYIEPIVILVILIANAVVGVVQETNAEKAIEALKEYSALNCTCLRDGSYKTLPARDLVPGDIISLQIGEQVPADCRVLQVLSSAFKVDQSILTGETVSISKHDQAIKGDLVIQDQLNMVFSGTTVTVGKALAIVCYTGSKTAIGKIHESISETEDEKTPLKIQLDEFGDQLAKIISVICILVWVINVRHFGDAVHGGYLKGAVYYFKIAVALAVAAIPEGLAVIITTCLALGTQKMAKQGAIVRKLNSVETLGCTSVICSDKTGTLTTNQMSVRKVCVIEGSKFFELDVTGNTYGPEGQVLQNGNVLKNINVSSATVNELTKVCVLCNDAKIVVEEGEIKRIGEPTEAALLSLVEKLGSDDVKLNGTLGDLKGKEDVEKLNSKGKMDRVDKVGRYYRASFERLHLFEFSRDRKSMSVVVENGIFCSLDDQAVLYCKGAPESIIERCDTIMVGSKVVKMTKKMQSMLLDKAMEYGDDSLRVLGFAMKREPEIPKHVDSLKFATYESGMTFLGLVGMLDPPRPQVKKSIQQCRDAGIRVIVITGDNKMTAESVCRQIGIFEHGESTEGKSFTGREFDAMSMEEKRLAVMRGKVFARTEPSHKSQLVDLLKSMGCIVAMTGDGVNDAPALKKADIGVGMGSGTDVAKLASDMVLADDNFATIVSAVQEGRSIYANTKQFIRYLISSNIGEVVSIFLTVVLGMPEALVPVQLLWVNLVTDGFPATALGFNPPSPDIMTSPPRDSKEAIVTPWLFFRYVVIGTYVGASTVFGYAWWFIFNPAGPQISFSQLTRFSKCSQEFPEIGCEMFTNWMSQKATTMSLSILVVVEMFNAMNSVSENQSLLTFPLWKNKYLVFAITISMLLHFAILYVPTLQTWFGITDLNWDEWMAVLWMSAPVILVDEVLKAFSRTRRFSAQKEKSD